MISVSNLNKTYDATQRHANQVLHNVSFSMPDTGFVCIVGASGCGKTSLLNAIGGLDRFDSGTISIGSVSVSRYGSRELEQARNNSFGYIFQNYYLLTDHSVAYNIYLGLHSLSLSHKEKLQRVKESLSAVNMSRYARRRVGELSGGQQQRVAIARALARRPRVIFADEPTGNLDEENTVNICTLLRRISKTSLVIMVTHEENIARFFADRIIKLSDGKIVEDIDSWERGSLSTAGSRLYTGDYQEETASTDTVSLRILHQEGAAPVHLTVAVLKDRIVLKLDDGRTVSCSGSEDDPVILEGTRPVLTLQSVDHVPSDDASSLTTDTTPSAPAGKGISWRMMLQEAGRLLRGKGLRLVSTWAFLTAMTVLSMIIVSDYITVSSVDPRDFIISDSHILEFELERGPLMPLTVNGITQQVEDYLDYLHASGLEFDVLPYVSTQLRCSTDVFLQMGTISESLGSFSHALISRLDENALIYGRMPEKSDEIVVDRWVLDVFLEKEGIIQSGIPDISQMLGMQLEYFKKDFVPTIVGICDAGEPTIYLTSAGLASVGRSGSYVIPLSELQALYPGKYDTVTLDKDECIVIHNNAGAVYKNKLGSQFRVTSRMLNTIVDVIEAETWAHVVIADEMIEVMLEEMSYSTSAFILYCADKGAVKSYLAGGLPDGLEGVVQVSVTDAHSTAWAKHQAASHLKADARTIVTVTVIALCIVMLYLLQRSCVHQRIGMIAVYRLLGIPGRKLLVIYGMESLLLSLMSVLPASLLTWLTILVLGKLPSLAFTMLLPSDIAALVSLAITAYYLAVSLLPVWRLLRLPPARLAGKYDM